MAMTAKEFLAASFFLATCGAMAYSVYWLWRKGVIVIGPGPEPRPPTDGRNNIQTI